MVSFIIIGEDSVEEEVEGFDGDHSMKDVREYWEEHFPNISWSKGTLEKNYAISIDKRAPLQWADVSARTLDDLEIRDGSNVALKASHIVG